MDTIKSLGLNLTVVWIGDHFHAFVQEVIDLNEGILVYSSDLDLIPYSANFTHVQLPACRDGSAHSAGCVFTLNPLSKFVWTNISTGAPEILSVISNFTFPQHEYVSLLQKRPVLKSASDLACSWVKDNKHVWSEWIPQHVQHKPKIYLLGLFPLSGDKWKQPGLPQGKFKGFIMRHVQIWSGFKEECLNMECL